MGDFADNEWNREAERRNFLRFWPNYCEFASNCAVFLLFALNISEALVFLCLFPTFRPIPAELFKVNAISHLQLPILLILPLIQSFLFNSPSERHWKDSRSFLMW